MRDVALTIAVPSYNRRASLIDLLADIREQAHAEDQILVIDDGSADGSAEAACALSGIEVVRHEVNRGMVPTWNHCLQQASRKWVCMIHNDDALAPGGLEVIRRLASRHPELGLIAHQKAPSIDEQLRYEVRQSGASSVLSSALIPSGATVSREIIDRVGVFDESLRYSSDIEYFARIAAASDVAVVFNPTIVKYRVHDGNHQYETWRREDFFEQLARIEDCVVRYAGLSGQKAETARRDRWTDYLLYMFRAAHRIDDRELLRRLGGMLAERQGIGRRMRAMAVCARHLGWCPYRFLTD